MGILVEHFSNHKELREQRLVRIIESLLGYQLTSYSLYITYAVGTALSYSLTVFAILFVVLYLLGVGETLEETFFEALHVPALIFFLTAILSLLNMSVPRFLRYCTARYQRSSLVFTGIVSTLALILCIYLSLSLWLPSSTQDTLLNDSSSSICENNISCQRAKSPASETNSLVADVPSPKKSEEHLFFSSEGTALEKLKKLFSNFGIEGFDIEERQTFMENQFAEISLFNKNEIKDWDAYFVELETVAETTPAYVGLTITKALHSGASFEIVEEILNRGHTLSEHHAASLASRFSIAELEKFENYGVEYNHSGVIGSALSNPNKKQVFDYFLNKKQWDFTEDEAILKDIIERSSILRLDPYYTRQLLERGAPVTDETLTWIESELKEMNLLYYRIVKDELKRQGLD